MLIHFDELPAGARIWIYPSPRKLDAGEQDAVLASTRSFLVDWRVHGEPLIAACTILRDHFLIIGVDEAEHVASGCSIDASTRAVKQVEKETGVGLSDRSVVGFLVDGAVYFESFSEVRKGFETGRWNGRTLTFNPAVSRKGDLESSWLIPVSGSWLSRYLRQDELSL